MKTAADLLPKGEFIQSSQLGDKIWTLTITDFGKATFEKEHSTLFFKETDKQLVLNTTNVKLLQSFMPKDIEEWRGVKIFIHAVPCKVSNNPSVESGVRIYGSPILENELPIKVCLPQRKPQLYVLKKNKEKS